MIEAVIKKIDREAGKVLVETEDGKELSLSVDEHTDISVMELETAGEADGTLADFEEGFLVNLEFTEGDEGCKCHTLSSIS